MHAQQLFRRIAVTVILLLMYYVLRNILFPGLNAGVLTEEYNTELLSLIAVINGSSRYSIAALSVTPTITLLFVTQLYTLFQTAPTQVVYASTQQYKRTPIPEFFFLGCIAFVESYFYLYKLQNASLPYISFFLSDGRYLTTSLLCLTAGSLLVHLIIISINLFGTGKGLLLFLLLNCVDTLWNYVVTYVTTTNIFFYVLLSVQIVLCLYIMYGFKYRVFFFPVNDMRRKKIFRQNSELTQHLAFYTGTFGIAFLFFVNYIFTTFQWTLRSPWIMLLLLIGSTFLCGSIVFLFKKWTHESDKLIEFFIKHQMYVPYLVRHVDRQQCAYYIHYWVSVYDTTVLMLVLFISKMSFLFFYLGEQYIVAAHFFFDKINMLETCNLSSIIIILAIHCTRLAIYIYLESPIYLYQIKR